MNLESGDTAELLKAVIALAVADGVVSGGELAIIKALAGRAGVDAVSLDSMIERAGVDSAARDELFARAVKAPERAMTLLVAAANIDGRISEQERHLLVDVSDLLGVSAGRFREIFHSGMAAADKVQRGFNPIERDISGDS